MNSKGFKIGSFTDNLLSKAVNGLDYDIQPQELRVEQDVDYAEMNGVYEIYREDGGVAGDLYVNASIPTDSDSPRYELKISGMNRVQEEVSRELERQSLEYFERMARGGEGDAEVLEGFIAEDVWQQYFS